MELSNEILSDITVYMKYAKYMPELNRRETWTELVTRNKNMHIKKYPELKDNIELLSKSYQIEIGRLFLSNNIQIDEIKFRRRRSVLNNLGSSLRLETGHFLN